MTCARNIAFTTAAFWRAVLCCACTVFVLWSGRANAHEFVPICDPSAASAVAPLPIYPRDHGEIKKSPCVPDISHAIVDQGLPERDQAPTKVQPRLRLFIVALDDVTLKGPNRIRLPMSLENQQRLPDGHRSTVYRPPR